VLMVSSGSLGSEVASNAARWSLHHGLCPRTISCKLSVEEHREIVPFILRKDECFSLQVEVHQQLAHPRLHIATVYRACL